MPSLLAVDLGLKTGLALFEDSGKLLWYRSHNFGTTERLRQGVPGILDGIPDLAVLVIEGGGNLATVWEKEAFRRDITLYRIGAAEWRKLFLYSREQRSGPEAKHHAGEIMIGLWGLLHVGWLRALPKVLQR
jgi:hypothetical protein